MNVSLEALLAGAAVWRARSSLPATTAVAGACVPSGWPRLDACLPGGGWPLGTLIELLLPEAGVGELSLLLPALRALAGPAATAGRRWLAWIAAPHLPYPPAFAQSGIRPERLLLVTTGTTAERLWAAEQALRSGSCLAVLLWLETADDRWLRRLKLAAETGGGLAILFRPLAQRTQASPAALRLALEPTVAGLDLWLFKNRGRRPERIHAALGS
jgi:protein ImuA